MNESPFKGKPDSGELPTHWDIQLMAWFVLGNMKQLFAKSCS